MKEQADFENEEFNQRIPDFHDFNAEGEYELLVGKNDIFKAIAVLVSHSLNENNRIYTNYSFRFKELDELIYGLLYKSKNKQNFCHVVTFTEDKNSSYNMNIAFALIKYMQIKINSYYRVEKHTAPRFSDELYSCYFVTNDVIVFFDKDISSGIYVRKNDFVQEVYAKTFNQFKNYALLCHFPDNVLSEMDELATITDSEIAIRYSPFVLNFFSKDDWNSCINDALENKNSLIDLAYSWYTNERLCETISISSVDGWLEFLKTGKLLEQADYLVANIDIMLRRKITEKIIENLRAGILTHRVIGKEIKLPKKLMVEQVGDFVFFVATVNDQPEKQWLGSAFFYLPKRIAGENFKAVKKYLEIRGFIYNEEKSAMVLENMLSHCQNEMTIKNILK